MTNNPNAWPEERLARLKLLWKTTNMTAKAIGEDLGITRNAVIGKKHRLGLSMADRPGRENRSFEGRLREQRARVLREDAKNERHAVRLAMRRKKWAEAKAASDGLQESQGESPVSQIEIPQELPTSGRPLLSLAKGECRWPSGHGTIAEPFLFCGATQAEGSSYCPRHSDEAYGPYVRQGGGLTPRITASYPLARKAG